MLQLDAAFKRLAAQKKREDDEKTAKQKKITETINQFQSECERAFGNTGNVDVQMKAKGVFLDSRDNGWLSIRVNDVDHYTVRIGKKPSNIVPPEQNIYEIDLYEDEHVADQIADWFTSLSKSY